MKILYAGNGVIGLLGLVEILSYGQFSIGIKQIKVCIDMLISEDLKLFKQDLTKRTYYPRGFPSFSDIKKLIPHISYDQYQRASYFPNKPK